MPKDERSQKSSSRRSRSPRHHHSSSRRRSRSREKSRWEEGERQSNIKQEPQHHQSRNNHRNSRSDTTENPNVPPPAPKEKTSMALSGKLMEDTNSFRGRIIKYNEPPEAQKPKKRWRLYPFKGEEALPVLYIHRQSAYLIGRDRVVADFPVDHPSCSSQHAVLQYRAVPFVKPDGSKTRIVKPYIIDLDSTNKTYLNNNSISPRRYYELKEQDVLKFGFSSREYVILHEKTDTKEVAGQPDSDEDYVDVMDL